MSENSFLFPFNHFNDFYFKASPNTFVVEEIPLYPFSNSGEHIVLKIRKKELTTWELIESLSNFLGVPKKEIGYAGLKDKHALTIQYISIPKKAEKKLHDFSHPKIKILEQTYHKNKIRIGHLKGNRFWLRFKKVLETQKSKIESLLNWIEQNGMPNYFGIQRFGITQNNYLEGKAIVEGKLKIRDRKKREFLIGAYQSYLFNEWLKERVKLSRLIEDLSIKELTTILPYNKELMKKLKKQEHFFKLLPGELYCHYPFGKIFYEELEIASKRFLERDIVPTGLLPGKRVKRTINEAQKLEAKFDNEKINEDGSRRFAWIFPKILQKKYIPQKAWYELEFVLPKGSYATILVDFLQGKKS